MSKICLIKLLILGLLLLSNFVGGIYVLMVAVNPSMSIINLVAVILISFAMWIVWVGDKNKRIKSVFRSSHRSAYQKHND
jgi:hypothetical protein